MQILKADPGKEYTNKDHSVISKSVLVNSKNVKEFYMITEDEANFWRKNRKKK